MEASLMSLVTVLTGAIVSDVTFDEQVIAYDTASPPKVITVTYKLKGAVRCIVTYTYNATPAVTNIKRVDVT
jgi:hypothetical protein